MTKQHAMPKHRRQSQRARRYKLIRVQQVYPLDNYRAHFVFTDGTERDIDLEQYLDGPVFQFVRNDPEIFRNMFVDGGTINWPGEVDIDPDTLYYGDEDPPWVKYDKEQALAAQRAKRAPRARTARKAPNGKRAQITPRAQIKKSIKKRAVKPAASRKKVLAKTK